MEGFIKLHRKLFESEIWNKPPEWLKIWLYILGKVNFSDNSSYKRGQNYFNYQIIASDCRVKYKSVENCVKFLKQREQIITKKSTRGVIIEVLNYNNYQDIINEKGNRKGTEREQKGNGQGAIIEEGKNERNNTYTDLKNITIERLVEVWNNYYKKYKLPRVRIINDDIRTSYKKIQKDYTKKDLEYSIDRYLDDISKRKDDGKGYINHRFTLYEFLIRKGGFKTFVNK